MFQPRSDASNTWRGILDNIKLLRQGSKMEVGNGKHTLFWQDNGLGTGPLCNIITEPIPPTLADWKVVDMWDGNRGWKWERLSNRIPQDIRTLIASESLRCKEES